MECGPFTEAKETDAALLAEFRATSNPQLLDELLGRYLAPLRNLMYQMVGNESDADDLTQDAIVKVFRGLHRFQGRSAFSTWVYSIGMNTARTFLRRRNRRPDTPLESFAEPIAPKQSRPDWRTTAAELDWKLREALAELSIEQRAALVLTVMQGLSAGDAARIENCPVATLYWRVYQGRRQLKKMLAEFLD